MTQLLDRLEHAEEGSRELDRDVAEAAGWERKVTADQMADDYWRLGDMSWTRETAGYPPDYTTSLDAALTLVPEGWKPSMIAWQSEELRWDPPFRVSASVVTAKQISNSHPGYAKGEAATPALALCAAALRARES